MPLFKYKCGKCKAEKEKLLTKAVPFIICTGCGEDMPRAYSGNAKIYKDEFEIPSHKTEIVEDPN